MPWKTLLTVALFTGAMIYLKTFDPPSVVSAVWQMPVPKPPEVAIPALNTRLRIEIAKGEGRKLDTASQLSDPTHELDHFYAALLKDNAVVLHYGDSPTTADLITADARLLLQKQFGDGGSGFVLIARPWAWYGHRGVEMDASNWKIDVAGASDLKDGLHGLGGASFRGSDGAVAHWTLKDRAHSSVEIAYLKQPGGGSFTVETKGAAGVVELGSADTEGDKSPGYATFVIPPGSKDFTLRVTRGSVRLYGADFRKTGPGIVYSSLGLNGANITRLTHSMNSAHWAAQLQHYHPDLVVIAFGTNESGFDSFVDGPWAPELKAVVGRIRAALPDASILLMSPMDRGERKDNGEIGTIKALPRLVDIESKVAAELDVAFFNTFEAMGGEGTMAKWYNGEPRLVGADFIHPMPAGAKIVGELLYNALRDGYNEYKLRQLKSTETDAGATAVSQAPPVSPRSDSSNQ